MPHSPNPTSDFDAETQADKLKAIKILTLTLGMVFLFALGVFIYMFMNKSKTQSETITQINTSITEHTIIIPNGATVNKVTTQDRKIITHYTQTDGRKGVDIYDTYTGKTQRGIINTGQ